MGGQHKKCFVVTGMHRSGTTLTGRILSFYPELQVIHEPFNKEFGLKDVHHVYPCDMDPGQKEYYLDLLDKLLEGNAGFVRSIPGERRIKAISRAVIGGRTGYDMARYRLRKMALPSLIPVFKDPFEAMLSRSLVDSGNRVIALVRHPCAVWLSIKRMDWQFDYDKFAYRGLFTDLALPAPLATMARLGEVEKMSLLWTAIYTYLDRLAGDPLFLLIRHEDLCMNPFDELHRIEDFLDIKPNDKARDFIKKSMFGREIVATGKQLHQFRRDSRNLSTSWHGRLTSGDEAILKNTCGPLVEHYYGRWIPL